MESSFTTQQRSIIVVMNTQFQSQNVLRMLAWRAHERPSAAGALKHSEELMGLTVRIRGQVQEHQEPSGRGKLVRHRGCRAGLRR